MNTLEKIKYLRLKNHLTQKQVADFIKTKQSNYSYYESGKWKFTIEQLKMLAKLFNVSYEYLLGEEIKTVSITKAELDVLINAKDFISKLQADYERSTKD